MKYETVVETVEAEQHLPGKVTPGVHYSKDYCYILNSLEEKIIINNGQWVVFDGLNYFVIPDNIFTKKYKLVEEHKPEHKPEHPIKK